MFDIKNIKGKLSGIYNDISENKIQSMDFVIDTSMPEKGIRDTANEVFRRLNEPSVLMFLSNGNTYLFIRRDFINGII